MEPAGFAIPAADANEAQLRKIVTDITKNIASNLRIKRVVTYASASKRYISIDCCFTKEVQVIYAHKIASQIEKETKEHFANAVVTVHMEPEQP